MPELPEIRAHAERLESDYRDQVLRGVAPLSFTALKTYAPAPESAVGTPLRSVGTRGKFLLLQFDQVTHVVHLMQGGRLNPDVKGSKKPRGGLFRWTFDDRPPLLLTEAGTEKKAGVWVVEPPAADHPPLTGLGPEADALDDDTLAGILAAAGNARLHGVLRDQHRIAGLGRRLANEICWTAQLSPFSASAKLDDEQRRRLLGAIMTCVAESITDERSRDHMTSSANRVAHVHHRTGESCDRCGDTLREVSYNAYTVNYCAACQTGGKVLADNTTSKFLK